MAPHPTKAKRALALSHIGRQRIRDVADAMDLPLDYRLISTLTGYRIADVEAVLRAKRYRHPSREKLDKEQQKPGNPIKTNDMPQFAYEVAKTTGLKVAFFRNIGNGVSEWLLLSPTNLTLMVFFGRDDILQGVLPIKHNQLQGISTTQLEARLASKKPRKEPEE